VGPAGSLQLMNDLASGWTDELTITSDFAPHVSAYFNKGVVAAQWVSRELDTEAPSESRRHALTDAIAKVGDPLRDALGGLLKPAVVKAIADMGDGALYAALYELNDPELLNGLEHLGGQAHIIALFQAYRWNTYVAEQEQHPGAWHGLEDAATWQDGHLTGQSLAELRFWTQVTTPATA
jgi:hypothetical protein